MKDETDVLYRFDEFSTCDGVRIYCTSYQIVKRTPKGAWINLWYGKNKFVLADARKRWACPCRESAMESFRARKTKQIEHLTRQLDRAKCALATSETWDGEKVLNSKPNPIFDALLGGMEL